MNVKISYTVPFEEVPSKVQKLLIENQNKVHEISTKLNQTVVDNESIIHVLNTIDSIRKALFSIDNQLGDCYSILSGYNKALADMLAGKDEEHNATDGNELSGG